MNKLIGILIFTCCLQMSVFAQRGERIEQVEAMKIAFITNAINLTPEQAQQFWPLYNAFQEENRAIRKEERQMRRAADLNESEAEALLIQYFRNQEDKLNLERTYVTKFRNVISAKQVLLLKKAEQEFKRKLLQRVGERRGRGRN